ncbi:hypothetical protein, partial [Enterobacter intestinihominis]
PPPPHFFLMIICEYYILIMVWLGVFFFYEFVCVVSVWMMAQAFKFFIRKVLGVSKPPHTRFF